MSCAPLLWLCMSKFARCVALVADRASVPACLECLSSVRPSVCDHPSVAFTIKLKMSTKSHSRRRSAPLTLPRLTWAVAGLDLLDGTAHRRRLREGAPQGQFQGGKDSTVFSPNLACCTALWKALRLWTQPTEKAELVECVWPQSAQAT